MVYALYSRSSRHKPQTYIKRTKKEGSKDPYKKPSIDHIIPKAKGRTNAIENLQFLTWFENRCKNDMSQENWNNLKSNIEEYFI